MWICFTALLLRENHDFPSSGFQNKTSFLFETRQPRTHVRVLGWERQRTSGECRTLPSPFPSPQDTGLLDNQTLLCIYSQTVNRKAILEDQRFLKNIFPGREVSFIPQISGRVGGSRLRNFLPRNWEQSALNGSPVWYECLFLNWNNLWKFCIRYLFVSDTISWKISQ